MKKQVGFKTRGMNRDLSVSAFNPEFSFENMNLRLSTAEGNTMLSWVNEKGTAPMKYYNADQHTYPTIDLMGVAIGTAVINNTLIVFTAGNTVEEDEQEVYPDHIYKLNFTNKSQHLMEWECLYRGDLKFDAAHPLETHVSYETDDVQKVYFTDNKNQPRVINIAGEIKDNIDTQFDFIPAVQLEESVAITQNMQGGGLFAPGVIQYALTYYNKHGQQSNVVYVSPLYYLALSNRGASPEEKVSCSFDISITDPDDNFDYLRIYSIQRTSLDATPIVKIVEDLKVNNNESNPLTYTDNGTTGSSIDPTELLFVGGKAIKVLTMTEKDKTLFMGNITQENSSIEKLQDYFLAHPATISFGFSNSIKNFSQPHDSEVYPYSNTLKYNSDKQTTFKGGEYYRFGIQLQKETGEWSEPIFLKDAKNNLYPQVASTGYTYKLPYAYASINLASIASDVEFDLSSYKKVRPVIVYPTIGDRDVICQGVLNPTVFNVEDRKNGTPFAQASWYFRPYGKKIVSPPGAGNQPLIFGDAEFTHYSSLHTYDDIPKELESQTQYDWRSFNYFKKACDVEIQGSVKSYNNPFDTSGITNVHSNTQFFVDQSIITLNSPDIEFDTEVQSLAMDGLKLRVLGFIPIDATASSHSITTESNMTETAYNLHWNAGYNTVDDHYFGNGELDFNTMVVNNSSNFPGIRMITGNIWNDSFFIDMNYETYPMTETDPFKSGKPGASEYEILHENTNTHIYSVNFFVHPWNGTGSLNNDYRAKEEASSWLKTKRESNLLFSLNTQYFSTRDTVIADVTFNNISSQLHLTENENVYKIGLPKQKTTSSAVSYYPNVDKVLNNSDGFKVLPETYSEPVLGKRYTLDWINKKVVRPIQMKYKSTSHAVIALNAATGTGNIPILPYNSFDNCGLYNLTPPSPYKTFWGDTDMQFDQLSRNAGRSNILWLGELYRGEANNSRFGGTGKEALKSNTWLIGGNSKDITSDNITLEWTEGDTYFQRYDCLKTYAFTPEDTNQLVEILSFMCETHVNIDGRYDNNRGQVVSHSMSPTNFNLLNYAYSQRNNFFSYKKTNNTSESTRYPNWITWSKSKESGADVDLWTNVTLGSVLELDGDKGEVNSLQRFNNQIIAFQDSAISQILYNERVQISPNQGVPIEIANSGKVDGKSYLSDTIGCSNKHSICPTPAGIYFMDSMNKGIFRFSGQLENISLQHGFDAWCKQNIPDNNTEWIPTTSNNFAAYYDKKNQEVLWVKKGSSDSSTKAFAWSDKHQAFTSFYDYGNGSYLCNLEDEGVWIENYYTGIRPDTVRHTRLWHHQAGDYCRFFGINKPYWMTLVGNPEPQIDKIFTNLEFRASVQGDGELNQQDKFIPTLPFDSLETWNEYQHGVTALSIKNGHNLFKHGGNDSALIRKFRIWRCDIPRDNYNLPSGGDIDVEKGIARYSRHPNDRMRNPWLYLKLMKNAAIDTVVEGETVEDNLDKAEIHDVVMTYFD